MAQTIVEAVRVVVPIALAPVGGQRLGDMLLHSPESKKKGGADREGQNSNSRDRTSAQTGSRLGATTDTCSRMSLCQEQVKTRSREPQYT